MDQVTTKKVTPAGDRDIHPTTYINKKQKNQKKTNKQNIKIKQIHSGLSTVLWTISRELASSI